MSDNLVIPPIWSALIGQDEVAHTLARAVRDAELLTRGEPGPAMTHAWLFTGPPGAGRSTAATLFASALVCAEQGCGQCQACRNAATNGHPDVVVFRPEGLFLVKEEAEELIRAAAMSPVSSPWRVVVIEDADRLNDFSGAMLLKQIEEPAPHMVWVLCAPTVEDVLPTIVSRVRHVALQTPTADAVAAMLVERYGIDDALASFAARASQGHIGRAKALATDDHARTRRQDVLRIPFGLRDLPSCVIAAAELVNAATEDARALTDPLDAAEVERLRQAWGADSDVRIKGQLKRSMDAAGKDLAKQQKVRATRSVRDQVDRALVDLMGLFRDVLVIQLDAGVPLVNEEMRAQIAQFAAKSAAADTRRRLEAIEHCRALITANVQLQLALEALMIELKDPWVRGILPA